MLRTPLAVVLAINLATLSLAQSFSLTMSPFAAVGPGGATSNYTVAAPPARVFGLFADFGGGPVDGSVRPTSVGKGGGPGMGGRSPLWVNPSNLVMARSGSLADIS